MNALIGIYKQSIEKWERILLDISHKADLYYIYNDIFSPCSFCKFYRDCGSCELPKDICGEAGCNGLVGSLWETYNRQEYKKVAKKVIKRLNEELKKLQKE